MSQLTRSSNALVGLLCSMIALLTLNHANSQTTGPQNGTCIIIGGGQVEKGIFQAFAEAMGGFDQKMVVIPTAGGNDPEASDPGFSKLRNQFRKQGFTSLEVMHTSNSEVANQDTFVAKMDGAKGIWFTGGRQWRLVDAYANTKTLAAIFGVLEDGGVIAGTSAGATIQGSYLARGDTRTNTLMMGDHQVGFGFISEIAIDQHVLRRNRHFDLLEIRQAHPDLLGIGLDENTALVIRKDVAEVIGQSYVLIYDGTIYEAATNSFQPHVGGFHFMSAGQKYNLRDRKRIK